MVASHESGDVLLTQLEDDTCQHDVAALWYSGSQWIHAIDAGSGVNIHLRRTIVLLDSRSGQSTTDRLDGQSNNILEHNVSVTRIFTYGAN